MKLKGLIAAPAVALLVTALAAPPTALPPGWMQAGDTEHCSSFTEAVAGAPSPKVFTIECPPTTKGFATAMQTISAQQFAGQRVRLAAQVQGENLQGWGGLWMRGDAGTSVGRAFDNMQARPLKGSFAWREAAVVLQLPADVDRLAFGFLMDGQGRLRATHFRLEAVSDTVPVTASQQLNQLPDRPRHLTPP